MAIFTCNGRDDKGGVTTFADMYMFMDETALAVEQSGMRGVLARGLQGPDENQD